MEAIDRLLFTPGLPCAVNGGQLSSPIHAKVVICCEWCGQKGLSAPAVTNAARRQTIPAFREKGVWKIGQ